MELQRGAVSHSAGLLPGLKDLAEVVIGKNDCVFFLGSVERGIARVDEICAERQMRTVFFNDAEGQNARVLRLFDAVGEIGRGEFFPFDGKLLGVECGSSADGCEKAEVTKWRERHLNAVYCGYSQTSMSFLDNLENSLKNLESREERDPNAAQRRDEERARTLAAAPWAERLKNSEFTKKLLEQAAVTGHRLRTKIYVAWLDTTLRLEAKDRKLELEPTAEGIRANFLEPDGEVAQKSVDLNGDPEELLRAWLG